MRRAGGHLRASSILVRHGGPGTEGAACCHAHEAVANCIKALLTLRNIVAPRVRELEYLHRRIPAEGRFPADAGGLAWLSMFGFGRWREPDAGHAQRALAIARAVRASLAAAGNALVDGAPERAG